MREYTIHENEAGQRLDKFLKKLLCNAQGSFVYKMLRKKNIILNGKKADGTEKLAFGDEVKFFLSEETFEKFAGNRKVFTDFMKLKELADDLDKGLCELQVLYEDADIIIINKPSGMLSQKAEDTDVSANEYILAYLILKGNLTEEMMRTFKPSICNRLDRNTSGILIAGKSLKGLQEMSKALRERTVDKYYCCIVEGEVKEATYLKGWLLKDETKNQVKVFDYKPDAKLKGISEIETEYRPIFWGNGYSELEVHLITGRSHQIRAHLSSIGHPIAGDTKYGKRTVNQFFKKNAGAGSQLLHAYKMVFEDGSEIVAPCGEEYMRARSCLKNENHSL